ncbi:hypothetical protein [Micromonospora inositola]|uniref:Uncharacterized protein n=1 Tax=Micromonospora inositola TaxID=47865 RepID=A0A1C5JWM0_9ACTN|nr:hypothetical protein [Micromonospora inositola]SCG74897.1 hypothetical protein GA0070613_5644 [Micromonospora inositola]
MSWASSWAELPERSTAVRGRPASAAPVVTQLVTHLLGTRTIPISGQAVGEVPRSTISGTRSLPQILQPAFLVKQPVQLCAGLGCVLVVGLVGLLAVWWGGQQL